MAKYHPIDGADIGFFAGADYSASSNRYLFVSLSSSADKVLTGTGGSLPAPIGVLQNTACAGGGVRVRTLGTTKLIVDCGTCGVLFNSPIICASDGQGERSTSASSIANAISLESVTSGTAIIEALLLPYGAMVHAAS